MLLQNRITKYEIFGSRCWIRDHRDRSTHGVFVVLEPATGHEANYGVINSLNEEHAESGVYKLYAGAHQASSTITYKDKNYCTWYCAKKG